MPTINVEFIRQVGVLPWASRYARLQFRKRVLRKDSSMVLPTGPRMLLPRHSHSATEVFVTGANIDWGAETVFARCADGGRDFLDVGAHIGYYSAYLSPLVRRAYAFEPDPRNLPSLQANARLAGNVEVQPIAVSSHLGLAKLRIDGSSSISSIEAGEGRTIDVPMTSIDAFVDEHPDVDPALIKTDIEGHDIEALRGMGRTVRRFAPLILTECGGETSLRELCADWGYSIFSHVRDRRTGDVKFRQMDAEDLGSRWYKMLFLAPQHLRAELSRLSQA